VEERLLGMPHNAGGSCGPNDPSAHRLGRRRNQPPSFQPFLRPYFQTAHPWPAHEDHMSMAPTGWVEPVDIQWWGPWVSPGEILPPPETLKVKQQPLAHMFYCQPLL
ncbi:hypothetical protein GOODEAATRI_032939, partial [Goodea atripinnis]